jgi:aquacobalamin reductase/NAD(P)H-flavin reductase
VSVTALCPTVYQAVLEPETPLNFKAGQYLCIVMAEDDKRPFSIASSPINNNQLELHIGAAVPESYAMQVIDRLTTQTSINIEGPFGQAFLRQDTFRPRIMIAGGTGFSYIQSMVETLLVQEDQQTTFFYWGCRDPASMYLRKTAERWAKQHPNLIFIPVFDNTDSHERQGTVLDAVCADFVCLKDYDVYIAGRFEMVGAARQRFFEKGIHEKHLYGDAFAFMK